VVEDISHEGLRALLRAEGVSFQAVKTWKQSTDPDYAAKKARVEHLYALADGEAAAGPGDPDVVVCVDEFGPLNVQPRPGRQWARRGGTAREPGERPRRRIRATYHRTGGVRHMFAALELGADKMYGHMKKRKRRGEFLQFCRYLRSLHPPQVRIAIVCDNFSPHLTTRKDKRVGQWAAASNAEIACTPSNASWMNRIECQFTALREFARRMQSATRPYDAVGRYGGEEFAVILRQTALDHAVNLAEQIRANVESKKLVKKSTGDILGTITISIGVAQLAEGESVAELIQRADSCLYRAKHSGRNCVIGENDPRYASAQTDAA